MSRKWIGLWVLAILVAAVIAYQIGWRTNAPTSGLNRSDETAGTLAVQQPSLPSAGAGRVGTIAAREVDSGLPPDVPLAESYETLRSSAQSGNTAAGCRLGTELARCAAYFESVAALDEQVSRASTAPPGSNEEQLMLHAIAAQRQALAVSEKVCRGIAPEQSRGGWRFVYKAAKAGHLPSMLAFSIQPPLSEQNFTADLEGWTHYRQEAVSMLDQAARRGSLRAVYHLAWVYGNLPVAGGAPLVSRDPLRATAYALVARQYAEPASARQLQRMIGRWREELGPDGMSKAVALASRISSQIGPSSDSALDFVNNTVSQPEDCDL